MSGSRHSPEDSFPFKLDRLSKEIVFARAIFPPQYSPSRPFSFGTVRLRRMTLPLQVLVRNQRLDLLPYIRHLLIRPSEERQHPSDWYALASSVAELVQQIAAQRTLIERHVYVIIPASQGARQRGGIAPLFGKGRANHVAGTQEQARQELALCAEALTQHLASCGLTCQRLRNDDLARLFYRCLTPERAIAHPLPDKLLTAVGHPTSVKGRSGSAINRERAPQGSLLACDGPSRTPAPGA
jgi:hypothetical protein